MKKRNLIGSLLLSLGMFLTPIQGDGSDVVISFPLSSEDTYVYEVGVKGNGSILDGSQKIREGIMAYSLHIGDAKTFVIKPDQGYRIKQILHNGKQQTKDVERITIQGVSGQSSLQIEFEKISDEKNNGIAPVEPSQDENSKNTNTKNTTVSTTPNEKVSDKENDRKTPTNKTNKKDTNVSEGKQGTNGFFKAIDTIGNSITKGARYLQEHPMIGIPILIVLVALMILMVYKIRKMMKQKEVGHHE